jgi:hypothetical protein
LGWLERGPCAKPAGIKDEEMREKHREGKTGKVHQAEDGEVQTDECVPENLSRR